MKTHLGNDYTNAAGVRVRHFQLLNSEGKAVALADFEGRECVRIGNTLDTAEQANAFFREVAALVDCSNPGKLVAITKPGELVCVPLFARCST